MRRALKRSSTISWMASKTASWTHEWTKQFRRSKRAISLKQRIPTYLLGRFLHRLRYLCSKGARFATQQLSHSFCCFGCDEKVMGCFGQVHLQTVWFRPITRRTTESVHDYKWLYAGKRHRIFFVTYTQGKVTGFSLWRLVVFFSSLVFEALSATTQCRKKGQCNPQPKQRPFGPTGWLSIFSIQRKVCVFPERKRCRETRRRPDTALHIPVEYLFHSGAVLLQWRISTCKFLYL